VIDLANVDSNAFEQTLNDSKNSQEEAKKKE